MAIFRGVGGSGDSSDNSYLEELTAIANEVEQDKVATQTAATFAVQSASQAYSFSINAENSADDAASYLASVQNVEVTSASFNTGNGVLTLTKLGGGTVTTDLDGRFLTSYTETNDLSTAVTWANVPDANITESSVTQYLTAANVTSPLTGGTGISIASNGTITNDSPDQTVALTGTGATTITGTYPNFTINSVNTTYTVGDGGLTTNDFTNADHTKLNGIEANATADQTGAEIKTAYEAEADTNAFTDAEKTKLSNIEATADVTDTVNVTAAGALMDSEVTNLAQVKAFDSSDYLTTHQDISGKANLSGASFTGDVNLGDNNKINIGASSDLQIYHDGSDSYIDEQGTGDLIVKGLSNIKFQRADTGTNMFTIRPNRVETYDASGNLITKVDADGLDVTGELSTTDTITAPNVDIATTGTVTTNIATGANSGSSTKVVNIATGYSTDGTTTVNIAPTSSTTTKQINLNGDVSIAGTVTGNADGVVLEHAKSDDLEPVLELQNTTASGSGYRGAFISMTGYSTSGTEYTRGVIGMGSSTAQYSYPYIAANITSVSCGIKLSGSSSSAYNALTPCNSIGSNLNNGMQCGHPFYKWNTVYATNGNISTSDQTHKRDVEELSEAETRVAVACKGLLRKYRWKDAYEEKGEEARIHFGIMAQDLRDAFSNEGLDASRYAMFCSDTWWEDETGERHEEQELAPEGAVETTQLGVRYEELLAFIIAAL